jgi:hypothetical protein
MDDPIQCESSFPSTCVILNNNPYCLNRLVSVPHSCSSTHFFPFLSEITPQFDHNTNRAFSKTTPMSCLANLTHFSILPLLIPIRLQRLPSHFQPEFLLQGWRSGTLRAPSSKSLLSSLSGALAPPSLDWSLFCSSWVHGGPGFRYL